MALLQRTRVLWTGFTGGPGYSNLFARFEDDGSTDPSTHAEDVATLFGAVRNYIPSSVNLAIDQEVALFDEDTGELAGFRLLPFAPEIPGNGTSLAYSAASGAAIEWRTGAVRSGRRVTGRTFFVPLAQNVYNNQGRLTTQFRDILQLAANAYVDESASEPVVWSRPRDTRLGWTGTITEARVRPQVAVLRSRRD